VIAGIWAALHHPWVFLAGLILFILLMIWLLPKILKGVLRVNCKYCPLYSEGVAKA